MPHSRDAAALLEELRGFRLASAPPDQLSQQDKVEFDGVSVPRFHNEFWTARQRQGHPLHEISYRACFKAQLPAFFIDRLTRPGDVVFDPFMGRGTTPIEAALRGRVPQGSDVNPLCPLLVRPRLAPPTPADVESRLAAVPWQADEDPGIALSMFYHPHTLRQLTALRRFLRERRQAGVADPVDQWIRMVAINRLSGHSKGFFSVYTMPPNQAVTAEKQVELNERCDQSPEARAVDKIILRKTQSLLRGLSFAERAGLQSVRPRIFVAPAHALADLAAESVDLTVTSPPFVNVVDYVRDNWLRCWFAEIDAEAVRAQLTMAASLTRWCAAMSGALHELFRVTRAGGWVAFEVGEVRGGALPLDEQVAPLGQAVGFNCVAIAVQTQAFTKTSNCWGVDNNRRGTNTNRIVLFRKP